jgi:hypothetical protein
VVVLQDAQEIGVGTVVRGIGAEAEGKWLGASGGVIQLTRHGSGLTNTACAQFEVFCNRCILSLAGFFLGLSIKFPYSFYC